MICIKLRLKKMGLLVTAIVFSISYIGCWNRRELNTIAIIQAVGVDKAVDNNLKFTFQVIKPEAIKKSTGSKDKSVVLIKSDGESSFDVFRNGTFTSDRKLFLPHNKVIIIGEQLAKEGIAPPLDFFARDHEGNGNVLLFISKDKAENILESPNNQESISAKTLENLSRTTSVSGKSVRETLDDFFRQYSSETSYAIVPGVKAGENKSLSLDDTAILKDDKLVAWLDAKETRGLLWTLGNIKSTVVLVKSPVDENKKLSLEVLKEKRKVSVDVVDGKPVINLKIEVKSTLGEQLTTTNLIKKEYIDEIEQKESKVIKDEIESIINKAKKELHVDILGFGRIIHKREPKTWHLFNDNWDKEFADLKVNVEVKSKIVRVGLKLDTKGRR